MRTATVRSIQHHLSEVLTWVSQGEEVEITRRNKSVARLVPSAAMRSSAKLPDFAGRARAIWGKKPKGKPLSAIVLEDREERL